LEQHSAINTGLGPDPSPNRGEDQTQAKIYGKRM